MNKLLDLYYDMFKEYPPLSVYVSYNHPKYVRLVKKALHDRRRLTIEDTSKVCPKRGR